jgi:hypothetical protein
MCDHGFYNESFEGHLGYVITYGNDLYNHNLTLSRVDYVIVTFPYLSGIRKWDIGAKQRK